MHACVRNGVDFVLAGSIRDDGPLPDVITDSLSPRRRWPSVCRTSGSRSMVATVLHSIAIGNMLPATIARSCRHQALDRDQAGRPWQHQAVGIVTDVEPFFNELLSHFRE